MKTTNPTVPPQLRLLRSESHVISAAREMLPAPVSSGLLVPRLRRRRKPSSWGLLVLDLTGIAAAAATAAGIGHEAVLPPMALWVPAWLAIIGMAGGYVASVLPERDLHARAVTRASAVLVVVIELADPWLAPGARRAAIEGLVLATAFALAERSSAQWWNHHRPGRHRRRVLVIGARNQAEALQRELAGSVGHDLAVAAVCPSQVDEYDGRPGSGSSLHGVTDAIQGLHPDVVLLAEAWPPELTRRLLWLLEGSGIELFLGHSLIDVSRARTRISMAGGLSMLHVRAPVLSGPERRVKELVERVAAAVLLLGLTPLLLLAMACVRIETSGPAIFRQLRVGHRGRPFTMYKVRTMTAGADGSLAALRMRNEADGVLFKVREDPRITKCGRVLRKYSVDEIPQLVNVIKGDMALVGPRPALPAEVAMYDDDTRRRLAVRPGLTGLWQVSGRSDLSWEQSVRLDLRYVDNWSMRMDLAILGRTLRAVFQHTGAY